ncbi:transglutaminase-like domain-containing protein [Sporosarcina sp. A2]|uniref:transglutaminase-like domain-containing protein n=1 Tax=Sporosarcina sp. A2 TaxID=3393449 RepID=UPI003D7B6076
MKELRNDKWVLLLLYVLAFFLTIEWLKPVEELTSTGHIGHFYGFIGLSLLMGMFHVPIWVGAPVKIVYILLSLQYVFYGNEWLSLGAMEATIGEVGQSLSLIWTGEWMEISYLFRTGLFFVLLWMISYLIRFWIEYRKSILLFFGMTVVFLSVVDTFTAFDASFAILRVMIIGLLLLGLMFPLRLSAKTNTQLSLSGYVKAVIPLGAVIVLVAIIAILVPIKEPSWPDPVPYIRSAAGIGESGGGTGSGISKVGYDPDDTELGGPFKQDDTLVFEAYVDSRQYWKMETKNTYTTKGWVQSAGGNSDYESWIYSGSINTEEPIEPIKLANVELFEYLPIIPYPYGFQELKTDEAYLYSLEERSGKLELNGADPFELTYQTQFEEPEYSLKKLRETNRKMLEPLNEELDEYLSLPMELPDRVWKLAEEITKDSPSLYQKAQAIESYFGKSGFVYARDNVAIPEESQDYVDQFLFESKRGYCDNFSSSMVVMLRSVGIPARWVKGFAPGEQFLDDDREKYYKVTNNQAHSWVEAFMPGYGWMPFEPTIGFNGISNVNFDIELEDNDVKEPELLKQPEKKKQEQAAQAAKRKRAHEPWLLKIIPDWLRSGVAITTVIGITIAVIAGALYQTRKRWLSRIAVRRSRKKAGNWETFVFQYEQLLKHLNRIDIEKPSGMTLATYAKQVDRMRGDNKMSMLTAMYEKGLYGQLDSEQNWDELSEMWEDLIIGATG